MIASNFERLAKVIRLWGGLGSILLKSNSPPTHDMIEHPADVSWEPLQKIIDGARAVVKLKRHEFEDLLERSNRRLEPFGDPLYLNFSRDAGWLNDREESYSDWLRWIVCQLGAPDLVFRLFGIKEDQPVSICRSLEVEVTREESLLGGSRRADLIIRYDQDVLIIVEVKTSPVGDEVEKQLADQRGWLNAELGAKGKHAILLAPKPCPEKLKEMGFAFLSWDELCSRLRMMVSELKDSRPRIALGMILGFVGAIEQNVLDYPRCNKVPSSVGIGRWPELADHLRESLNPGGQ